MSIFKKIFFNLNIKFGMQEVNEDENEEGDKIVSLDEEDDILLYTLRQKRRRLFAYLACNNLLHVKTVAGKAANRDRTVDWERVVARIIDTSQNDPVLFQKMFRLHKDDFWELYRDVNRIIGIEGAHRRIPSLLKFAVTLRWLAGGSYLDLSWGFHIPHNTIHRYFYEVLSAIDAIVKNIRFPLHDEEGLNELEEGFIVALLTSRSTFLVF